MSQQIEDPCGEFGPVQQAALVWFVAVILLGCGLTYGFMNIDRRMYDSNAEFFDYTAYRENRNGQLGLRNDSLDDRSHADYSAIVSREK